MRVGYITRDSFQTFRFFFTLPSTFISTFWLFSKLADHLVIVAWSDRHCNIILFIKFAIWVNKLYFLTIFVFFYHRKLNFILDFIVREFGDEFFSFICKNYLLIFKMNLISIQVNLLFSSVCRTLLSSIAKIIDQILTHRRHHSFQTWI